MQQRRLSRKILITLSPNQMPLGTACMARVGKNELYAHSYVQEDDIFTYKFNLCHFIERDRMSGVDCPLLSGFTWIDFIYSDLST